MKLTVLIKDPDALETCVDEAVARDVAKIVDLDEDEFAMILQLRSEKIRELVGTTWTDYGEVFRIEFDTDNMTARVLKKGE